MKVLLVGLVVIGNLSAFANCSIVLKVESETSIAGAGVIKQYVENYLIDQNIEINDENPDYELKLNLSINKSTLGCYQPGPNVSERRASRLTRRAERRAREFSANVSINLSPIIDVAWDGGSYEYFSIQKKRQKKIKFKDFQELTLKALSKHLANGCMDLDRKYSQLLKKRKRALNTIEKSKLFTTRTGATFKKVIYPISGDLKGAFGNWTWKAPSGKIWSSNIKVPDLKNTSGTDVLDILENECSKIGGRLPNERDYKDFYKSFEMKKGDHKIVTESGQFDTWILFEKHSLYWTASLKNPMYTMIINPRFGNYSHQYIGSGSDMSKTNHSLRCVSK